MIYQLNLAESGVQYVVALLMKQPLGESGPLFDDIRTQVAAQEAAAAAAGRKQIEDELRTSIVAETAAP